MKAKYNINKLNISFEAKDEFKGEIILDGQSIELEFSLEEMTAVMSNAVEGRKLFIEGVERITPVVKDAIKELGLTFSEEIMKHEKADFQMRMERESVESTRAEVDHQRRMEEIEAEKK